MKLNKVQWVLFSALGILALIGQFLSIQLIIIIVAMLLKSWTFAIIGIVVSIAVDIYRHKTLKKMGMTPHLGRYKKD